MGQHYCKKQTVASTWYKKTKSDVPVGGKEHRPKEFLNPPLATGIFIPLFWANHLALWPSNKAVIGLQRASPDSFNQLPGAFWSQDSMSRSRTNFTTEGASTGTATFTVGLSDHSVCSPNLFNKVDIAEWLQRAYSSGGTSLQAQHMRRVIQPPIVWIRNATSPLYFYSLLFSNNTGGKNSLSLLRVIEIQIRLSHLLKIETSSK